jgi:hypothetical protein
MKTVRDSQGNVYRVPEEVLQELKNTQKIVYDAEGLEYGLPETELAKYQVTGPEAETGKEFSLIKILTPPGGHVQISGSSRCCNVGDVVTWCKAWD